jgi:hypothetical protein
MSIFKGRNPLGLRGLPFVVSEALVSSSNFDISAVMFWTAKYLNIKYVWLYDIRGV